MFSVGPAHGYNPYLQLWFSTCKERFLTSSWCNICPKSTCCPADDATIPGRGVVTNIHITDQRLTGPVPQQACLFRNLKELDLDGGRLSGTIPEFLTTCFPDLNELDLSYNQVSHA